ncbi:tetratricopeptide repeat protein 5-like isoform X1 [Hydra vulgaris]|uniref:Tetratricopeptide repeat protein 5-like isoform X1 n=1 Tax=Hydra vulgaris TaxID=6087 RepID=A0ABM4DPZ5_HYDVU
MAHDALKKAEDLVNQLIEFKENYASNFGSKNKNDDVEKRLKDVLLELDQLQLMIDNKAKFFCLRGKALNVLPYFDSRAVESLSKAVKLDPTLIEAWNELGESYWKDKKIEEAQNCFQGAINKNKNKVSLRNLSMVQRQLGSDFNSRVSHVKESVSTAKEAVALDLTDGRSWFVLGNAYLSLFFYAGQCPKVLKQSLAAYAKAESDIREVNNADLYYNKAVVLKFQELYEEALKCYKKASLLAPSWNDPKENIDDLYNRLKTTVEMIENKGYHKSKKLNLFTSQLKDSDFGIYSNCFYKNSSNQVVAIKKVLISDLNLFQNNDVAVCGKVIAIIPVKDGVPFSFIMMDSALSCIAVSVFNLAVEKGLIVGDTVAISNPFVQDHNVTTETQIFSYKSIRVETPLVMMINKRKVGPERLAFSVLTVANESE